MKKVILILCFFLLFYGRLFPQESSQPCKFTIEKPNSSITLKEILVHANSTELILVTNSSGNLNDIGTANAFYIHDLETNKRYDLKQITPTFGHVAANSEIHLFFDKISVKTKKIDIIEGICESGCWNTYGVKIIKDNKSDSLYITKELMLDSINRSNYLQNTMITNSFFTSSHGGCYLKYLNSVYKKMEDNSDWKKTSDFANLCFDPNNPNIEYTYSENIVSKSMNYGVNWREIQNGLPAELKINSLIVNPYNSSEVFLLSSTGLYKTSDEGFTWSIFYPCLNAEKLFIINKNRFYLLSNSEIFSTTDEGKTWNNISKGLPSLLVKGEGRTAIFAPLKVNQMIFVNNTNNSYVLAMTDKGLYKSIADSLTWTLINNDYIGASYIFNNSIYIGGSDKNNLPVLYKSEDGTKWDKIKINANDLEGICGIYKDNLDDGIYINSGKKIAYIDTDFNVIGLNYGLVNHSIVYSKVTSIQNNKEVTYVLIENNKDIDVENYGVWKTVDNGKTWIKCIIYDKRNESYNLKRLYVSPFNPLEIWLFDKGFYVISFDGGSIWGGIQNNKVKIENGIEDFQFDPTNINILFFVTTYNNGSYMLIRYDKNTGGLTELRKIENEKNYSFIISKDNNKGIFISNCDISNDGGWTWHSVFERLDKIVSDIGFDINTAYIIPIEYVGHKIEIEINEKTMWHPRHYARIVSEDDGETWKVIKTWEDKKNEND